MNGLICRLLEDHWIRCGKELNQWELLQDFGNSPGCLNSQLVLESAWRTPNWPVVRDALTQLEQSCPKEYAWKVILMNEGKRFQMKLEFHLMNESSDLNSVRNRCTVR